MDYLSLFKCKNCGGELDVRLAVNGVIECEYCHTPWTVPKKETASDALKYLHDGNAALDVCKFEDAFTYFQKAAEFDKKEPEAYFGMALAQFKVQYLKDEVNNCLQPICHEISEKVFTEGKNYKKALELATVEQKKVYRKKGGEIDNIRDEFYALKNSGLSYNCFICVKVTEADGRTHTEDYNRANDIYYHLKDKGYKPFYSEREMKERTGSAYEALILYALYTSECMLIVCSNEDYLQTKWVKNEYTRFINLMQEGGKERDALTFVFTGKPIEKLPNGKKIQGIDLSKPDAYSRISEYIDSHTPEARKKKAEETATREKQAEQQKEALATMQKQIDALSKAQTSKNTSPRMPIVPQSGKFWIEGTTLRRYQGEEEIIKIPDGIRKIDNVAFHENQMIQKVIMPDSVTIIGDHAFSGCTGLKGVVLSPNLKDIGDSAFSDCARLTEITIPQSVEVMGCYVFSGCRCAVYVEADRAGEAWDKSWNASFNGLSSQVFWGCKSKEDRLEKEAKKQQEARVSRLEEEFRQAQRKSDLEKDNAFAKLQAQVEKATKGVQSTVGDKLTRAWQEMDARDFTQAQKYFTSVLDSDPTNEDAWRGMFLADFKVTTEAALLNQISINNVQSILRNKDLNGFLNYKQSDSYNKSYREIQMKCESVLLANKNEKKRQIKKMKRSRFLWGLLRGIGALILAGIGIAIVYGSIFVIFALLHAIDVMGIFVHIDGFLNGPWHFGISAVLGFAVAIIVVRFFLPHHRRAGISIKEAGDHMAECDRLIQECRQQFKALLQNKK